MTTALVVNPAKAPDVAELHRAVEQRCAALGLGAPVLLETTEDDPGEQMTTRAVREGADLVLVAGGDGTVRSVCCALQGCDLPLGILPLGTGNLLARNLDLPLDLDAALEVALTGRDRRLDLARVSMDGAAPTFFAVMAGIGFDAEMMVDAPERMKAAVGWPAYVISGLRHLRDRPSRVELSLDGGVAAAQRVRGIVVGNVGALQAGVTLLPDAVPDDGVLDVVVLAPRGLLDWARVLGRLTAGSASEDHRMHRSTARTIRITTSKPTQAQLDGDPVGTVRSVEVDVAAACLVVRAVRASPGPA